MMLVEHILDTGRKRLAILGRNSLAEDAAKILTNPSMPLVLVCDTDGIAVGLITRTDALRVLANARGDALATRADAMMNRCVFSCRADQPLQKVWEGMSARSLRCAPVLDSDGRPLGVLHARDVASALLEEVTNEELQLRDYVLGIGYQ